MKSIEWTATGVLILLATLMTVGPALPQIFHEDFDGPDLDPSKWNLDVGDGTFVLSGGYATLSCPAGGDFPFLTPVEDPFPAAGDFLVRVGFRYPHVLSGGNGFGAQFFMRGFGVWQDSQGFLRAAVGDVYPVTLSTSIDTSPHVYEWLCLGETWSMWFDGDFVTSDDSNYRPVTFFFGHPPEPHPWWTTQEIDYVHIEWLGSVPVDEGTRGVVKKLYR